MTKKPDLETLRRGDWHLEPPGTCSPTHFRRMQIEKVDTVSVDASKVHQLFPGLRSGDSQAARDISISNRMKIWPERIGRLTSAAGTRARDIRIDELESNP
jgi:hypothetical protein